MINLSGVAFGSPAFKPNPFPLYAKMQAEAPALRAPLNMPLAKEAVLLTRYADVATLLRDPRFSKERANAGLSVGGPPAIIRWIVAPLMNNMLDKDDPDHARLRRLVQTAFTPKRVDEMKSRITAMSEALLNKLDGRSDIDLIADFAMPLPVGVIAEMLGVPKADHAKFVRWSNILIDGAISPVTMLMGMPSLIAFMRYVRAMVKMRRVEPQDDLTTDLVKAQDAGEQFSEDELVSMIILLLTAGHETTTHLIGNGMLALLQNPDQLARLRAEPQHIDTAIEELLRFAGPVEMSTFRYAREDIELGGLPIRKGEAVLGVIAAANRDERQFADPHKLDITRDPNRHLTFGMGGHYCLGAPLARLEGRIAIPMLLERFPNLRLAKTSTEPQWRPQLILRGLKALPLQVG
jgi:cytochrome P450